MNRYIEEAKNIILSQYPEIAQHKTCMLPEILLQEGTIAQYIYYIESGILGVSTHNSETADDKIIAFFEAGEMVFSCNGIINNLPSILSIKSLTKCDLYVIDKNDLWRVTDENSRFYELIIRIDNYSLYKIIQNFVDMSHNSPMERYKKLINTHPNIVKSIKNKDIASWLNVTPTYLSHQIKNKLFKN
ncbi:MAG: Crp/Fnr family transcriptional regulator [Ignavibacteria bacterium]|jgi:CRP-like cAMP-binding protein|nr:Crp/Fnr family transcriptional regulator [Ignavibacteria bacterium]